MEIGLIHPSTPQKEASGASHSATQIAEGLSDKGYDVVVFCREEPVDDFSFETRTFDVDASNIKTSAEQCNNEITKRQDQLSNFDIVHSYLMRTIPSMSNLDTKTVVTLNAYGAICPRNDLQYKGKTNCQSRGRIKCKACTAHQAINLPKRDHSSYIHHSGRALFHFWKRLKKDRIAKDCINNKHNVDVYHALSHKVKQNYSNFGYDSDQIHVVNNIFDDLFDINHKSDFTPPYKLLYVARLKKRKGADRLPEIIHKLTQKNIDVTLTIAGEGYMMPKIESDIDKYGLGDEINIKGHVPYKTLPELYANHDLFIYPARWDEPFGRVFLESMGTGTPVLSTDIGDVKSIIGDGGKVVQSGDPINFACEVEKMLNTDSLKVFSENGKNRVQQFSASCIVDQFLHLYENMNKKCE